MLLTSAKPVAFGCIDFAQLSKCRAPLSLLAVNLQSSIVFQLRGIKSFHFFLEKSSTKLILFEGHAQCLRCLHEQLIQHRDGEGSQIPVHIYVSTSLLKDYAIKTHGSESRGQEEAACMRVFWPTRPLQ